MRTGVLLSVLLLGLLALSAPITASCATSTSGSVMAPNPRAEIPPWTKPTVHQATVVYYLTDLRPGTGFELQPKGTAAANCLPGGCLARADFNIVFYSGYGLWMLPTAHFSEFGDDQGTVPANAAWAAVYLRATPDYPELDGTSPYPLKFVFRQGC